jgi:hypothetical protein
VLELRNQPPSEIGLAVERFLATAAIKLKAEQVHRELAEI